MMMTTSTSDAGCLKAERRSPQTAAVGCLRQTAPQAVFLVVVAAGASSRMGGRLLKADCTASGGLKQYMPLAGGTVLSCSVKALVKGVKEGGGCVKRLAVSYPANEKDASLARQALYSGPEMESLLKGVEVIFAAGGASRQESVYNALNALDTGRTDANPIVLIHDAARPFVSTQAVQNVLQAALNGGGVVPAVPVTDTVVEAGGSPCTGNCIALSKAGRHLKRDLLFAVQTPQAFPFEALLAAHRLSCGDGTKYTDDSEIYDKYDSGGTVIVPGDVQNIKITYPSDIRRTPHRATERSEVSSGASEGITEAISQRIGLGWDSHVLVSGRPLMIGGVEIPFDKGEKAHSDGDVLLHAVIDAVLGAAHMGDIGEMFPPQDDRWRGASSLDLLRMAWQKVLSDGWQLVNIDCVVRLEKPHLLPYREKIIHSLAASLGVPEECISFKAKTAEGLPPVGTSEAVEAQAVCLITRHTA